ncbi:MAG: YceI family protein [Flavobacteriaceae bacterium]|nr:YceI family protein [Flavobacteriaceae bacterium]
MRTNVLKFLSMVAVAVAIIGCKEKANEVETNAAKTTSEAKVTSVKYKADTAASSIAWTGFKPTGKHNGTINIESGVFSVNDGKLESGTFLIDMNSIVVSDIPAENPRNAGLVDHLKNEDFFDVQKYGTAAFDITGFEVKEGKNMLSGNLTMKDKKNNITIPVTLKMEGDMMTITSEAFTIDRTKWDIRYKSKSIFGDLGDKFINDEIELKINVKAKAS